VTMERISACNAIVKIVETNHAQGGQPTDHMDCIATGLPRRYDRSLLVRAPALAIENQNTPSSYQHGW